MKIGDLVEQTHRGTHRQGVIYKIKEDPSKTTIIPWTYFDVLWSSGERSVERADHIKHAPDLLAQFNDLVVLRDLQDSVASGASYD